MIDFNLDVTNLNPADYNPRYLSVEKKEKLKKSILELGFIKVIVVNKKNNVIIAGHQRTNCLKEIGLKTCPAFIIDNINKTDEVRFNQFHNETDIEVIKNSSLIKFSNLQFGWNLIKPKDIIIEKRSTENNERIKTMCKLILKYGNFNNCIANSLNYSIISNDYAAACKLTNTDLYVFKLDENLSTKAIKYFSENYGVFNYDNLERKTYIQTLAQKNRLQKNAGGSRLYDLLVIPFLKDKKHLRILDFGSGKFAYVNKLYAQGYNIKGIEFYKRKKGLDIIDVNSVNKDIDNLIKDVKDNGLYDVVICDSVLNFVDSQNAENHVINTLKTFCKKDGLIFLSGRSYELTVNRYRGQSLKDNKRNYLYFTDENKLSGNYRQGNWFYQKFHDSNDIDNIGLKIGIVIKKIYSSAGFYIICENKNTLERGIIEDSINFEFNLPLPIGSYNRQKDVLEILWNYYK